MFMQHLQDHLQQVRIVAVEVKHIPHNAANPFSGVCLEEGGRNINQFTQQNPVISCIGFQFESEKLLNK